MPAQDIMFGRAVRFTCDHKACEARHTTLGEPPYGWQFVKSDRSWYCPRHNVDDFDDLCDELMEE